MSNTKWCGTCRRELPLSAFAKNRRHKDGFQTRCSECRKAHYATRAKIISLNVKHRFYGISPDQFNELLRRQGGRCAICKKPEADCMHGTLAVDHSHETNEVRGLLCESCNFMLAQFGDDPARIAKAIEYLKNPPAIRLKAVGG